MITVGIVGASGYSGGELLRLLTRRTDVEICHLMGRSSAGERIDTVFPFLAGTMAHVISVFDAGLLAGIDVVFLALPSGEAMNVLPSLLGRVGRIIDLGGDFRLTDPGAYAAYYRREHTAPQLLGQSVYGLPELYRDRIRTATLVANPGCYPTSILLALAPALAHRLIRPEGIVITSYSGVSGAGRSAAVEMSFGEVNENIRAYRVGRHQHVPEVRQILRDVSGHDVTLSFVPHLAPMTRGIYTTIHADPLRPLHEEEVRSLYAAFYAEAPFVRVTAGVPEVKSVAWTNYCDIGTFLDPMTGKLLLLSTIDNLVKGAAGQAIQNMNLMCGLPETASLFA
jgi:N-acetyl-gamma-glutamyl-phosphate reductase